jgi:hypothetical protein
VVAYASSKPRDHIPRLPLIDLCIVVTAGEEGLGNTSVSLMLAGGMPVHVVAAWHGHDPAVSLSIYSHAQRDDLRAAAAALFS